MPKVTMAGLAERLGVSVSTVSRAFSRPELLNEETVVRIREEAQRAGFRPNIVARNLVRGETGLAAMVVPYMTYLLGDFYSLVRYGIEDELARRGYSLVHASFADPKAGSLLDGLLSKVSVDGAIVIPQRLDEHGIRQLEQAPIRCVLADYQAPSVPSVYVDNFHLGYTMARHVLDLGHRRIGVLAGHADWWNATERLRGIRAALEEFSVALPAHYLAFCHFTYAYEEALAKTPALFSGPGDRGPTAILAANDTIAAGVYRIAEQMHRRIPHDLSVVGCDDAFFASYLSPALTTVDQSPRQIGKRAVELLLGDHGQSGEIPFRLLLRASTAPPQA